ncbi:unnamed protein product [Sphagnum tenellum]
MGGFSLTRGAVCFFRAFLTPKAFEAFGASEILTFGIVYPAPLLAASEKALSELRLFLLTQNQREWLLRIGLTRSSIAARLAFLSFSSPFRVFRLPLRSDYGCRSLIDRILVSDMNTSRSGGACLESNRTGILLRPSKSGPC